VHVTLRATSWRLTCNIVNKLHLRVSPNRLAHLNGKLGRFFCTLDVLEFDCGGHLLRVAIDADDLAEAAEEGVDLDVAKLFLRHILYVNGVATRVNHVCLLLARLAAHLAAASRGAPTHHLRTVVTRIAVHGHVRALVVHVKRVMMLVPAAVVVVVVVPTHLHAVVVPAMTVVSHLVHAATMVRRTTLVMKIATTASHVAALIVVTAGHLLVVLVVIEMAIAHVTTSRVP